MKRSEINEILREADAFIRAHQFYLPPFAYWTPDDWRRRGPEVAAIVGVEELARLDRPSAEPPMGAMALVGLWHEVADTDIDTLLADIYAERERDAGRQVEHAS